MSKATKWTEDTKAAEAMRDLDMIAKGVTREDCVRDAIASVRIEGGDITPETRVLMNQWAEGKLSDDALVEAVLAPYRRAGPGRSR